MFRKQEGNRRVRMLCQLLQEIKLLTPAWWQFHIAGHSETTSFSYHITSVILPDHRKKHPKKVSLAHIHTKGMNSEHTLTQSSSLILCPMPLLPHHPLSASNLLLAHSRADNAKLVQNWWHQNSFCDARPMGALCSRDMVYKDSWRKETHLET